MKKSVFDDHEMLKPDKKLNNTQNKRLKNISAHVGGAVKSNSNIPSATYSGTNPYEISDEEVRRRRAIREDREDIQAAFGNY